VPEIIRVVSEGAKYGRCVVRREVYSSRELERVLQCSQQLMLLCFRTAKTERILIFHVNGSI
jgi:hypothetical protein